MSTTYDTDSLIEFMLSILGSFVEEYDIQSSDLLEAVNTVVLQCGVDSLSEVTDALKVRSLATVEAYRYLYTTVSTNFDYSDGEVRLYLSQVRANVKDLMDKAISDAAPYTPFESVGYNKVVITKVRNDLYNPYFYDDPIDEFGSS